MRRITTPVLCLLLGLLMVFVVLLDVSGAAADDDDDDDDRRSYRYSEWRDHGHYHGKKYRHHRHGRWHGDDDHEDCDEDDDSYRHAHGHGHRHHGHRQSRRSPDWRYIEEEEVLEVEPSETVIWRNPDRPVPADPPVPAPRSQPQPRIASGNSDASASGPCREYYREARIGGRTQQIYGLACRQPDGSWKFVP